MITNSWENLNLKNYLNYINNIIINRGLYNVPEEYYEVHHIILRSFGGEPDKTNHKSKHKNLVWLTLAEHYTAHKILALDNLDNYKIVYAYMMMCTRSNGELITSPEEYQYIREAFIRHDKEINTGKISPMRGKHYSDEIRQLISRRTIEALSNPEVRQKISQASTGRIPWNKGRTNCYTDEALYKMSVSHQHPLSEQHKQSISNSLIGHVVDLTVKQKISDSQSGENYKRNKKIICLETGIEYYNAKIASETLDINHSNIIQVCKGNRLTAGGLHFKYKDED